MRLVGFLKETHSILIPMENARAQSGWRSLGPDLRAALVVAVAVVAMETVSDLLPLVGFLVTIPVAVIVYFFQGLLVGRFLRGNDRAAGLGPAAYARMGLRSALWTGALLSPLVALASTALLTPVTVGLALAAIPAVFGSGLVDLLLNLGFTSLGAWWLARSGGKITAGKACVGIAAALLVAWIAVAVVTAGLIVALIRGLPFTFK